MATFNGAPADTVAPGHADTSITKDGFTITTRKLPILKAGPIDDMTKALGITPPEMIFGDNLTRIEHPASGWSIEFNAFDALDRVDKTGEHMFKVSYSKEWQQNRQKQFEDIKEVVKPFDWSYSTDYKGTRRLAQAGAYHDAHPARPPARPDPIHFFDEVVLYEDELADNGIAMLSCKIHVMPARLLLLVRFFMRLDDVVFRIRDTRVFSSLPQARSSGNTRRGRRNTRRCGGSWQAGKKMCSPSCAIQTVLAEHIPVVEQTLDGVKLK